MNSNSVYSTIRGLLYEKLINIESYFNADVFSYYGTIVDGIENAILGLIEELAKAPDKKERLIIILTTTGGSVMAVERYVNIIRQHYDIVEFVVPNHAYSSGTIFCMSGDNIQCRAEEIAKMLNKNDEWNSHGRPINIETLKELGLKIEDYSTNMTLRGVIRDYYDLQSDFVQSNNLPIFVQTRKYI